MNIKPIVKIGDKVKKDKYFVKDMLLKMEN